MRVREQRRRARMTSTQRKIAGVTALLVAVTIYGVYATGTTSDTAPAATQAGTTTTAPTLDERALSTALELARFPTTASEVPFAKDALRIADQEMDLAFAYAVRQLAAHPQPITKEAQEIQARLQDAQ